jgi:hypothetical protein
MPAIDFSRRATNRASKINPVRDVSYSLKKVYVRFICGGCGGVVSKGHLVLGWK